MGFGLEICLFSSSSLWYYLSSCEIVKKTPAHGLNYTVIINGDVKGNKYLIFGLSKLDATSISKAHVRTVVIVKLLSDTVIPIMLGMNFRSSIQMQRVQAIGRSHKEKTIFKTSFIFQDLWIVSPLGAASEHCVSFFYKILFFGFKLSVVILIHTSYMRNIHGTRHYISYFYN